MANINQSERVRLWLALRDLRATYALLKAQMISPAAQESLAESMVAPAIKSIEDMSGMDENTPMPPRTKTR